MITYPKNREIEAIKTFVVWLMCIKKQFDTPYKGEKNLRHLFLRKIDVLYIQDKCRDRVPQTSQIIINRVENRLSDKPKPTAPTCDH